MWVLLFGDGVACGVCGWRWRLGGSTFGAVLTFAFAALASASLSIFSLSLDDGAGVVVYAPPRLGVSGDRDECWAERYVTRSLYVRCATEVSVDFHVPMGVSNWEHCCREFSSQPILVMSLITCGIFARMS